MKGNERKLGAPLLVRASSPTSENRRVFGVERVLDDRQRWNVSRCERMVRFCGSLFAVLGSSANGSASSFGLRSVSHE